MFVVGQPYRSVLGSPLSVSHVECACFVTIPLAFGHAPKAELLGLRNPWEASETR